MKNFETMIRDVLCRIEGVVAIFLYGSQATGTAKETSDVDIAVLFDIEQVPSKMELIQLREDIIEQLGKEVDLVCLNDASPILGMQVQKYGKQLYVASEDKFHKYFADLITDYADLKRVRRELEKNIKDRKYYG